MDASVFQRLGGGSADRSVDPEGFAGGGRKNCDSAEMPKYQQMLLVWREQVSRCLGIERRFAGEMVVSLEWLVL